MPRSVHRIDLGQDRLSKDQLIQWATQFQYFCVLDSHGHSKDQYGEYELLVAADTKEVFNASGKNDLSDFQSFQKRNKDWIFGGLSYELKDQIEDLQSRHQDFFQIDPIRFFVPKYVFIYQNEEWILETHQAVDLVGLVAEIKSIELSKEEAYLSELKVGMPKAEYEDRLKKIKDHIQRGDIYEMNFCQEFYSEQAIVSPAHLFRVLCEKSRPPFSALFGWDDQFLICASPERYLKLKEGKLISQPIKGTRPRSSDKARDQKLKQELSQSQKDKSENVMIVDLVRNDLSKLAQKGSVEVEELFGIYSFPTVHQMISTVACELREGIGFEEIIRASFPMGSMTGAPKIRAMQLIEDYEKARRSWYSGSVGYIDPNSDFDFNVVIRSFVYDAKKKRLSLIAGGAITIGSDVGEEYEECFVKADALFSSLGIKKRPSS